MRVYYATKKPVTVQATEPVTPENMDAIRDWIATSTHLPFSEDAPYAFMIDAVDDDTAEIYVNWGDRVVKGAAGEFYPIKPDIFLATYDCPALKIRAY